MYIVFFLLMAANLLAQESYVIDSVCVGAERTYRRDGEAGYTYYWEIIDRQLDDTIPVSGVDFTETNGPDVTRGSEIQDYRWEVPGEFAIVVTVFSEHNCDTIEQGIVKVFKEPFVYAGPDSMLCMQENEFTVSGDTAGNYSALYWETLGDGTIIGDDNLHPTYQFGTADMANGEVSLVIKADGVALNNTCEPVYDTATYYFSSPEITLTLQDPLCYNDSNGYIIASIDGGLAPFSYIWEGPPGFVSVNSDSIGGLWPGRYILSVTDANGCAAIDTSYINQPEELLADIAADDTVVCEDGIILLAGNSVGGTGGLTHVWTGNGAIYLDRIDSAEVIFSGAEAGDYQLVYTVTDENACTASDSIVISVLEISESLTIDTIYESDPPYVWNGSLFHETGIYHDTIVNAAGCDSLMILDLTVLPIDADTIIYASICEPDDYVWNGVSYTSSGTYVDTLVNALGRDSIVMLELTVSEPTDSLTIATIYESDPLYPWNDSLYHETGIYYDTIANAAGCDSFMILDLTVLGLETTDIYDTICAPDGPYEFNGNFYDIPGVYSDTLALARGGDSIVNLYLTIFYESYSELDTTICAVDAPFVWNGKPYSESGTYRDTLSNFVGCDSLLALNLIILDGILTEQYDTACVEFTWTEGNDSTYYQSGTYDYIIPKGKCADTMRLHLIISPSILLDTIITDVLCYGDSNGAVDLVVAGGIEPYTFLWSNGETTQSISGLSAGTYTVTVTDSLGCEAAIAVDVAEPAELQIALDTVIDVTLAGASTGSIEVSVGGGTPKYNYQWINEAGDVVGTDEDLIDQPAGEYIITVRDTNECQTTVTATIFQPSLLEFADIDSLCQFAVAPELPDTALNGTPGYWLPNAINTAIADDFQHVFYPDSGYHAEPFNLTVTVVPAIDLNVDPVDPGYNPNPVGSIYLNISGGREPYTINWTYPDGNTAKSKDIVDLPAGDYRVEVSDNIGCYDSLSVSLRAFEPEFSCPPDTLFECPDVTQYPPPTNIAEFIAMGGYYNPDYIVDNIATIDNEVSSEYCLTLERTYVIEDIYGRFDSCTQTINFHDTIPPLLNAPEGDTVECYSSAFSTFKDYADFIASGVPVPSDNCGIDPSTFTVRDTLINVEPGRSELIYYYSIADLCGNVGRDTTYFLVLDKEPPEVFCADITVYLDENGTYQITVQDSVAMVDSVFDNCTAPENLRVEIEVNEITCEDIESGTQARIVVYDEVGLSDECVANITVVDTMSPVALCRPLTIYLNENGQAGVTAEMVDNGSYDNCTDVTLAIDRTDFDCVNLGDNTVTLTVTDEYGLQSTCDGVVTVIDSISPQISCIGRDTVQLSEEDGTYALSYDMLTTSEWENCEIVSRDLDRYVLDCDDIEASPVTITAFVTDQSGNIGSCTVEFVVLGNIPPNVLNDSAITAVNVPVEIPVTRNDYDLKTNINLESLGVLVGPGHGSVVIDKTTGSAMYTPDRNFVGSDIFYYEICDDGIPCKPECGQAIVFVTVLPANEPPVAVDDYFEVPCGELFGNVLYGDDFGNGVDYDPDAGDKITVSQTLVTPPDSGVFNWLDGDGNFEYIPFDGFFGTDSFEYRICDDGIPSSLCATAWVHITRVSDNDCDGVADVDDIDDDNDGIRDNIENGGYWPEDEMGLIDSDHDGIPDYMDIDSDNDGIPDNIEGQGEHNYIPPTGVDSNGDGWDDVYDVTIGGVYTFDLDLTDTDGDSMPDYLDIDSDNDGVFDMIEGHDADHNGIADVLRWYSDEDRDGLDDAYDIYYGWAEYGNEIGSNAPLQDFDDDGTRDWRDINDEDDDYLTVNEDLNGNGDYSDDDLDLDGYPEYLDTELNCELFIPEGFSPNDDDVHDFFQILCIQKYPNAKLMIFNRNGVKLWEKEHYGNLDVWGTYYDAWWWGTSENVLTLGRAGGLPAGNYIYVLLLNDGKGTVKNGTVMLAY